MNCCCHYFQFVVLIIVSSSFNIIHHQHHHGAAAVSAFQHQITTKSSKFISSKKKAILQHHYPLRAKATSEITTTTTDDEEQQEEEEDSVSSSPFPPAVLSEPCNVVFTHTNADFDSLAAAVALSLLWSHQDPIRRDTQQKIPTHVVLPRGVHPVVQRFVAFHKHLLPLRGFKTIQSEDVHAIGVVDAQSANRIGRGQSWLANARSIHVFDHHDGPNTNTTATTSSGSNNNNNNTLTQMATELIIDKVGSVTTLIVERLKEAGIQPAPHEATLFCLGIRADTGGLVYDSTTIRDARALVWCMENGASQNAISEFGVSRLPPEQRNILNIALQHTQTITHRGLRLSSVLIQEQDNGYVAGLAQVCEELLGLTDSDVFLLGATHTSSGGKNKKNKKNNNNKNKKNKKNNNNNNKATNNNHNNPPTQWISLIGRATVGAVSVNLNSVLQEWGGGGHPKAAAAAVRIDQAKKNINNKNETSTTTTCLTPEDILQLANEQIQKQIPEQLVASSFMKHTVTTAMTEDTVESTLQMFKEHQIKSAPVVDAQGYFMGSLKMNDLVQAMRKSNSNNNNLLKVKGLMRSTAATVLPDTSLAELEYLMVTKGIGRLPVVDDDGVLVGLVTRTDVLRQHDLYDDI